MTEITTTDRIADNGQDVWFGGSHIGTIKPADDGWYAYPAGDSPASWHAAERDAVYAVVHAHTGGGYITAPMGEAPAASGEVQR